MTRDRAVKIVLVVVGLLFVALVYPLATSSSLWRPSQSEDVGAMFLSLYVTLGVFLLLAARNPSANRSLIAFAAWSSFAHAAVMMLQSLQNASNRRGLLAAAGTFIVIGVVLIVFAPAKLTAEPAALVGALIAGQTTKPQENQ